MEISVKKSTQWDIVGVLALVMALTSLTFLSVTGGYFAVGSWASDPSKVTPMMQILIGFFFAFSFLSFALGYSEGKKTAQDSFRAS